MHLNHCNYFQDYWLNILVNKNIFIGNSIGLYHIYVFGTVN
jgi:hypothetical protein